MPEWPAAVDPAAPWFHGSPEVLTELRPGSTITQDRDLARVFSHKPTLVGDGRAEGGALRHNGRRPGWLYTLAEPLRLGDLAPIPGSTMLGQEWHTVRPLRVVPLAPTVPVAAELLSSEQEAALRGRGPDHGAPR
jgi:hypothetical protein